jgi:hypothetical protein
MDPSLFLCQSRRERSHHPPGIDHEAAPVCWGSVGGRGLAQRDEASSDEGEEGQKDEERVEVMTMVVLLVWAWGRDARDGVGVADGGWWMVDGGWWMTDHNLNLEQCGRVVVFAEETERKTGF